jgi:hypothetical protein
MLMANYVKLLWGWKHSTRNYKGGKNGFEYMYVPTADR